MKNRENPELKDFKQKRMLQTLNQRDLGMTFNFGIKSVIKNGDHVFGNGI